MNDSNLLTIEQQFKVRVFSDNLNQLSHEEIQEMLVLMYETSLMREKLFKQIIGEYLGLAQAQAV